MLNDNLVIKKATVTEYPSNDYQPMSTQNRPIINASANYLEDLRRDLVTLSHWQCQYFLIKHLLWKW